ncbi:recombinase family protein [Pontibacter sp. SGAir0037]|uniref:recombinase family protein n=1 Tax=Pontibacter sp. SGAir0037 TaxID=2571030 RepID=UPI0010CD60DD|nr:recombinase family protein [Pontibacter sp. SGAir0037]QCR23094.1 DNA resolvase [Pontibacter sp. SGAir0037]
MTQVALFVRVSKNSQDYNRQICDLSVLAKQKEWEVVATIAEKISGATKNADREGIQKLLELAHKQGIDKVLVTEVSRLGRKTSEVLQVLEKLTELGVSVYVLNYNMETINKGGKQNPIAQMIFTLLAEFARLERETLVERINSGLEQAKRRGIKLGRREGSKVSTEKFLEKYKAVVRQLNQGKSVRDIAAICEVGTATVQKVKKALGG